MQFNSTFKRERRGASLWSPFPFPNKFSRDIWQPGQMPVATQAEASLSARQNTDWSPVCLPRKCSKQNNWKPWSTRDWRQPLRKYSFCLKELLKTTRTKFSAQSSSSSTSTVNTDRLDGKVTADLVNFNLNCTESDTLTSLLIFNKHTTSCCCGCPGHTDTGVRK